MDHAKHGYPSAEDVALMHEVDNGWDQPRVSAPPAVTPPAPTKAGKAQPPRRDTDRHITLADVFAVIGTPYDRQQRQRAAKPVRSLTLVEQSRRTGGDTEYRVIPDEEETPFLLTTRAGLHRRGDAKSAAK